MFFYRKKSDYGTDLFKKILNMHKLYNKLENTTIFTTKDMFGRRTLL